MKVYVPWEAGERRKRKKLYFTSWEIFSGRQEGGSRGNKTNPLFSSPSIFVQRNSSASSARAAAVAVLRTWIEGRGRGHCHFLKG